MISKSKLIIAMLGACAWAEVAHASTAIVPFTGTIVSTCVLTVGTPGVLAPNGGNTQMASSNTGGVPGSVAIVSTGSTFSVSAQAPTAFTLAPATGSDNVSFAASYSAVGATSLSSTLGTVAKILTPGLTTLTVDLTATKSTGVFAQGVYQTEVVVRCE